MAIHTMEYYSAMKRNEILINGTTWMNLEDKQSERSQSQKITDGAEINEEVNGTLPLSG